MPSKRGVSKKFNRAKCFTSPRKIDKRSARQRSLFVRSKADRKYQNRKTSLFVRKARPVLASKSVNKLPFKSDSKFRVPARKETKKVRDGQENKTAVPTVSAPAPTPAPQQVRVFALGHFHQLLQVAAPGSLVVLDIDETLIVTRHMPSMLLATDGIVAFQKHVTKVFPDFESRNFHCRKLQEAIKDKQLVEEQTADVIKQLQDKGCRVFALTARYTELAQRTEQVLKSFDILFKESAPFPAHPIQDPVTKAVVKNGIVYCNGEDKGYILSRLLSSVILPRERKEANKHGVYCDEKPAFPGIHFVDDRLEHTLSVRNSLRDFPSLNTPAICFHYRSPISLQQDAQRSLKTSQPKLLPFIMDHFIAHHRVLSNTEAIALMKE